MSPEANKPEGSQNTKDINTDEHPEGVRPFTRPLGEVADDLQIPENPSAIDPVTRNVEFQPLAPETQTTTEDMKTPEKKSHWKTWIAGLIGGAVLAGGGAVLTSSGDTEAKPSTESSSSAPGEVTSPAPNPETQDPVTTAETVIANLNKKATPEQIEYVIDNPVNIAEAPTVGAALAALSDRLTVMVNSGEPDLDAPAGEIVFTPETQASYDAMGRSVMDATSPNYDAMLNSLKARRHQIGAMFMLDSNAETEANMLPTSSADEPLQANSTIDVSVDTVWTTNQPDNRTSDGKYNNDYNSTMTLSVDAAGDIRVYNSANITDIGNIG